MRWGLILSGLLACLSPSMGRAAATADVSSAAGLSALGLWLSGGMDGVFSIDHLGSNGIVLCCMPVGMVFDG